MLSNSSSNCKAFSKKCSVPLCEKKYLAKGYCTKHYQHIRCYGKILERTIMDRNDYVEKENHYEIILRNVKHLEVARTLIDKDNFREVIKYKWHKNKLGYCIGIINNKHIKLHQFLLGKKEGYEIDHQNRKPLDNRRSNLSFATRSQNCINRGLQKNNTSGFKGVHWNKKNKKWKVLININNKGIHLGYFKSLKQAVLIRARAEIIYFIF